MSVALVEHPDRHVRDLSSCTAVLSGAAPAPVWLWETMRSDLGIAEITTGYGMTETGGAMTMTLPEDPLEVHSTTVGRPKLAGVAGIAEAGGALCVYRTIDPMTGDDLAPGEEGELASRGPTHMLGFWSKPAETAEAIRDGWVRSGDLGRIDERGYLQLTGRSKELYKSGGELVMPKEIEDLLTQQPGVSQAYAVGVPDERWGEIGCVFVVPEEGAARDADRLLALCRERLARFKVPRHVFFVEASSLPTTPTGKVQKFRLTARAAEELGAS
jgi:fatty-acyl-CoA synthase